MLPLPQDRDANQLGRANPARVRPKDDASQRPLENLRKAHRAADKQPRLHNRHHRQPNDLIDSLDLSFAVPYHHEGPFDASLRFRNRYTNYAPVEALRESNSETLRATPREYIRDSLTKRVPLQGTATIPPGMMDLSKRVMDYEEGPDLMREQDAAGGAYKRWEGIHYLDSDLKGKGEPSFSMERAGKEKARLDQDRNSWHHDSAKATDAEMQPFVRGEGQAAAQIATAGSRVRQPRASHFADDCDAAYEHGLARSTTSGRRPLRGLKSALGSLKRRGRFVHGPG